MAKVDEKPDEETVKLEIESVPPLQAVKLTVVVETVIPTGGTKSGEDNSPLMAPIPTSDLPGTSPVPAKELVMLNRERKERQMNLPTKECKELLIIVLL
jgi:hypothetical protein